LISAGLAGALTPAGKVGQVLLPSSVLDAATGGRAEAHVLPEIAGLRQAGLLVTSQEVAGPESKELLARQIGADWVDMEAAAVAAVAADHRLPFVVVKAISDECGFAMPPLQGCVDAQGRFLTGRFVRRVAVRPALWPALRRLAVNSRQAAGELCRVLSILLGTLQSPTEGSEEGFKVSERGFKVSEFQSFKV
jgi:adenosylhomocysteine nucleosidase